MSRNTKNTQKIVKVADSVKHIQIFTPEGGCYIAGGAGQPSGVSECMSSLEPIVETEACACHTESRAPGECDRVPGEIIAPQWPSPTVKTSEREDLAEFVAERDLCSQLPPAQADLYGAVVPQLTNVDGNRADASDQGGDSVHSSSQPQGEDADSQPEDSCDRTADPMERTSAAKLASPSFDETVRSLLGIGRTYQVIYVDVPWPFSGGGNRSAKRHYPTMKINEIKALPVSNLAADDCALFLWATFPQLERASEVIKAWGFEYKTNAFTWIKTNKGNGKLAIGNGYWTRSNAEICLFATIGKPQRLHADVHSVVITPRGRHSEKPDEVRQRIVRLMGDVPRIELFARQQVAGWDVWGNEVECVSFRNDNDELLAQLKGWLEDAQDFKAYYRRSNRDRNFQPHVRQLWTMYSGEATNQLRTYLHRLPEEHQAIWESLGRAQTSA